VVDSICTLATGAREIFDFGDFILDRCGDGQASTLCRDAVFAWLEIPMASPWKCLKKVSLGVSCSGRCSIIVAADAAMVVLQVQELLVLH
jgi:hypothetical protein